MPGEAAPEWCLSTAPCAERSGSCELPLLSCYLRSLKGVKARGPRQRGNLWALLPSQALCLDRDSIPATVHIPFPQLHTWHMGNSFQAQPARSGLQEGQSPMARAWMWARAAAQLLVGAGVGAAAASCLHTHPHGH